MDRRTQGHLDRMEQLIEEGRELLATKTRSPGVGWLISDTEWKNSWVIRCENIIEAAFGTRGPHYKRLQKITGSLSPHAIESLVGLLVGGTDDLKGGFLVDQEMLIAGEVLDSVLEEATALQKAGYHHCAAVLGRVALEDALRRLAREEGVDASQKASGINDDLKEADRFPVPKWRQIQAWLDVGNAAAHGETDEYGPRDVARMLDGVRTFLAMDFHG